MYQCEACAEQLLTRQRMNITTDTALQRVVSELRREEDADMQRKRDMRRLRSNDRESFAIRRRYEEQVDRLHDMI